MLRPVRPEPSPTNLVAVTTPVELILPTETLSAGEVLKLRDEAYKKYHNYKPFLNLIEKKFGIKATSNIKEMSKITLKRKIFNNETNK